MVFQLLRSTPRTTENACARSQGGHNSFFFAKSKTYHLPNKTSDEQIEEHFCLHRVSSFSPLLCSLRINDNLPVGAGKEKGIKPNMIYICDNQCKFICVTISIICIIYRSIHVSQSWSQSAHLHIATTKIPCPRRNSTQL